MIRLALVPILALALVVSVGSAARAESDEEQAADPGTELFRQALSDYRTAMAELRELCTTADDDSGVATARRRAPKAMSACMRGMKELRSFLVEVRKTAHEVRQRHAEDKEARRLAKEAAKEAERQAEERAEEERKDAERRSAEKAEKAKRDEAARLAQKAKQAEKSKQQEHERSSDLLKQKSSSLERELAELRKRLASERADQAKGELELLELRKVTDTKTGEERAKYEQKIAAARQHAAEHQAMAMKIAAKVAELEKAVAALPKQVSPDLARKAQKLREQIRSLDGTIAYKRGLEQAAVDKANEYRGVAAEKLGAEREKYLYKASEMDRQADEWARYVREYEEQRDRVQAELDALGL